MLIHDNGRVGCEARLARDDASVDPHDDDNPGTVVFAPPQPKKMAAIKNERLEVLNLKYELKFGIKMLFKIRGETASIFARSKSKSFGKQPRLLC
jgi:hypothetical protein